MAENVELYGKYLKLEMALLIGGVSFAEQDRKLMKGVDILIATPGRLLDQFERGKILMTGVQTLVVDEADRMLDMGFIPDIERIFKLTPFTRQVLFFSATMPAEIKRLVDQFLHQPITIQVARRNMTAETVTQRIVRVPSSDPKQKRTALRWLIDNEEVENGIVFCNRKRDVDIVAKSLNVHGHSAAPIHGDLAQSLRTQTLENFKGGKIKLLVASDVAARGLDVPSVSHVFNYDVPNHSEDYVHRIGRTGRAGREGDAIMLVARLDQKNYDAILHLIKVDGIEEIDIPGIENFPKDGGKHRSGRGDKRGRGGKNDRSRGRNRNSNDSPRRKAPERSEAQEDKTETKPKKKVESRRAAPKRKKSEAEVEELSKTPKTRKDSKAAPSKKKSTDKSSEDRPSKSKPKSQDKGRSRKNGSSNKEDTRKSSKDGKRRYKDTLKENTSEGFGDSMPAFFKATLK